ncbi:MAG: YihY/virulence factor BrkB family protein [Chitinophagales bacterium]
MRWIPEKTEKFWIARWEAFENKMKRTSLPGFDNIPIYDVVVFFREEIRRDQLPVRASAISFNFLLAIFPSIIFLFTLIPYIPIAGLDDIINNFFRSVLPDSGYTFLESTITGITSIKRGGLLSLGFVLAFYFSTNGVRMLLLTFDKDHPIYKKRGFWRRRVASARLTFYLFILFLISIMLVIAGDSVIEFIATKTGWEGIFNRFMLNVFKYIIILFLFFAGISLIYYYGPAAKHRWRFITPGATFATIVSIVTSVVFGYLVNNFVNYNEVYGSIGTLIALMVWINLNSLVLLVGFEINNSINVNRVLRKNKLENSGNGDLL